MENDPKIVEALTKKEMLGLRREKDKLEQSLGGIKAMRKLPDAIFVVDPKQEEIAVKEARKLGVPVISVIDSNCDPDLMDYKVPGNDDAIRAIRLFCAAIADAIDEGKLFTNSRWPKKKKMKSLRLPLLSKSRVARPQDHGRRSLKAMDVSSTIVKELREKTGAGFMDCKKALTETGRESSKGSRLLAAKGLGGGCEKSRPSGGRWRRRRLRSSRR